MTVPDHFNHIEFSQIIREARDSAEKDLLEKISKEFGHYSDGCGCCADLTLKEALLSFQKLKEEVQGK